MFVKPNQEVLATFDTAVTEARAHPRGSSLDEPRLAAQHLKTNEDLSMFYGESHDADVFAVVIAVTAQVSVAVGAMVAATVLAVNGPSAHTEKRLGSPDYFGEEDVAFFDLDALLSARQGVLAH